MLLKSKLNEQTKEHKYNLEHLKKLLNVEKKYAHYNNFKTRILDVAKKYIDQSPASPFTFEYRAVKTGKMVTDVILIIIDKRKEGNYYKSRNLLPNYRKTQEYKKYKKLKEHESQLIGDLANRIILFVDEHGFDMKQQLLQFYVAAIEKELENFNIQSLSQT